MRLLSSVIFCPSETTMPKTATVNVRINQDLKQGAEAVMKRLGINASQVVTLLYRQIELRQGLPFAVELPNETTRPALQDARDGKNQQRFSTLDALYQDLEI